MAAGRPRVRTQTRPVFRLRCDGRRAPEPPWVEPAVTVAAGTDRAMLTMILDVLDRRGR
jgi:hypothetical protein